MGLATEKANPELAANLSAFRHCVEQLVSLQEASLVIAERASSKAREEFSAQLDNNAQLIHILQGRVTAQEQELSNAQAAKAVANEELSSLKQKYGELDERYAYAQHQLSERAQRISALEGDLEASRGLPSRCHELLEMVTSLQAENRELSDRLKDAALAHAEELSRLRDEKHQVELELASLRSAKV